MREGGFGYGSANMTCSPKDLGMSVKAREKKYGGRTTQTSCSGGFCGPGGSQLAGSWSLPAPVMVAVLDDLPEGNILPSSSIAHTNRQMALVCKSWVVD